MRHRKMIWKFAAVVCTLTLAAFLASTGSLAQQEKPGPSDAEKAAAKAAWPRT